VIEMLKGALAELRVGDPATGHRRRPGDRRRGPRQHRPPVERLKREAR
jgi:hypothetical protein